MEKKIPLKPLPFDHCTHQVYLSNVSSAWIIASQYHFPLRGTRESAGAGNSQGESGPALDKREYKGHRCRTTCPLKMATASGQRAAGPPAH